MPVTTSKFSLLKVNHSTSFLSRIVPLIRIPPLPPRISPSIRATRFLECKKPFVLWPLFLRPCFSAILFWFTEEHGRLCSVKEVYVRFCCAFWHKMISKQYRPVQMWWHTHRNHISSFGEKERVHLNRPGRQLSRLLAAEVCASAVVMMDTPCSEVVWRVLATHSIRQLPLHFPSRASPCAITFQLESTTSVK